MPHLTVDQAGDMGPRGHAIARADPFAHLVGEKTGTVGVEPHPFVAVEAFAGVHQQAGELGVQQGGQHGPPVRFSVWPSRSSRSSAVMVTTMPSGLLTVLFEWV